MFIKKNIYNDYSFLVTIPLAIFPLSFLLGNLIINLNTFIIVFLFLFFVIKNKNFKFFKNIHFQILIFFWFSLLINLYFSTNFENSFSRVIGFLRFILLVFAIKYFFDSDKIFYKKIVFNSWILIFFIISLDLIFEFIFGYNTLGFKSYMPGRLSGFLGEELKIGHLFIGFFLICAVTINKINKKYSILILTILFGIFISLIIGERSNFLRFFAMCIIFLLFIDKSSFFKKIFFILISILVIFSFISINEKYNKRFYGQFLNPIIKLKNPELLIKNTVYGANFDRAIKIFEKNKFFGIGINNFRIESGKEIYENKNLKFNEQGASTHPHQIHLEILCESGVFGYAIFLITMITSIYLSLSNFFKKKNLYTLSSLLYIIFALVPILPSGSFFTTFGATIFWINYGLMISKNPNQ